ncbi:IS200/IS605 family transposase [Microscilla marina]|uniref:Transposase n=1 Tax=Microscilla marina ATCC 23134 TaxID=313606 RepID=A1ZJY1_MICM2|nr:IS200/IS605 family transposase [Microscilla marina]EAY29434.1 transposase [Microscilla marina ATCC 23134]
MEKRWKSSKNSVYNLGYHIIWCPKYRRKVLTQEIQKRLKELLLSKAKDLGIEIETMEVMKDHVHLFIKAKPIDAPHFIIGQLKGYTSRHLRQEFPQLKSRLPTLWTRSYYVESVGHISEKNIKKYIENQKMV